MSSISHLHAEAEELPVRDHLHLLSSEFLAQTLQPSHVSHVHTTLDQGPGKLKQTQRSKVLEDVSPYLEEDGTVAPGNYVNIANDLHMDIVTKAISRSEPIRILSRKPPTVHKNERSLPRITRVTMSQLRSGHCARLRDFQCRIGKTVDSLCSGCQLETQTVSHLFDCPTRPTTLSIEDLWKNPLDAADFLRTLPDFADLPLGLLLLRRGLGGYDGRLLSHRIHLSLRPIPSLPLLNRLILLPLFSLSPPPSPPPSPLLGLIPPLLSLSPLAQTQDPRNAWSV